MASVSAAAYVRISRDTESDEKGVVRQEEDCRALADQLGLTVVEVYVDNDIGASTRSKKDRPQYRRMLEHARAGRVGVILAYSNSRLTRRPMELEDLITLHERHGTRIFTKVSGNDDLSTADGRMVARIKASVDAAEAERIGERVQRKHLELAQAGASVGTRTFGWKPDGSLEPREAKAGRAVIEEVLAGSTLASATRSLNEAGVLTVRGNEWSKKSLRYWLLNPRLCGWRVYRGEVVLDASQEPVQGLWEPLVDADTHRALVGRLRAPEGRSRVPRRDARHYMLTGLLRCGACGGPMYGAKVRDRFYYKCSEPGRIVSISGVRLDRLVGRLLVERLAQVDLDQPETEWPGEAELREVEGRVRETMSAFTKGELPGSIAYPMLQELEDQRSKMQKSRTQYLAEDRGPALKQVTQPVWDAMTVHGRRTVAERLLEVALVKPATRGHVFDPERVTPVWRR